MRQTLQLLVLLVAFTIGTKANAQVIDQNSPYATSITKLDSAQISAAKKDHPDATPSSYYLDTNEEKATTILLKRNANNPPILNIKGRASLNHVKILEKEDDDFPIIAKTFRGVHYEAFDLKELKNGKYFVYFKANHSTFNIVVEIADLEGK